MNLKDYTSIHKIKQFMANNIAPQYFDIKEIDATNVGLFGYVTETMANNVEDSFLATTMLFKECFPVTAEDPESIYLMAALFQMDNHFAHPSTLGFNILINEDDVISHATFENGFYTLKIDRDMVINIDDIPFMLDYDVSLSSIESGTIQVGNTVKKVYTHSASYIMESSFNNTISDIHSPYIPTRVHTHTENGKRYVLMTVNLHQVSKSTIEDTVLTNDRINIVTKEYSFSGKLANFEIFYRASDADVWRQMKKFVANSSMVSSDPCCYYKFVDDGKLAISFNTDERYFIPAFNSQLKIEMYTTLGVEGNFSDYTGEDLSISASSTKYESNRGLIFIGNVRGGALGGYDAKSVDELKIDVIKAFSTVMSFTTANDLTLYFNNLRLNNKNELLFLKQRDDALKRLFSAFVLFKNDNGNVIPTNTVDILYKSINYDSSFVQSGRYVINAGKLYEFKGSSRNVVVPCSKLTLKDDLDKYEGVKNIYVNPFLTIVGINPAMVGYYINTINDDIDVDFYSVNQASFNQFVVNSLHIERNALSGEKTYKLLLKLYPTTELPESLPAFTFIDPDKGDKLIPVGARTFTHMNGDTEELYIDNGILKAVLKFDDVNGYFVNLRLNDFDEDAYYMTAELSTNDFISLTNRIAITRGMTRYPNDRKQSQEVMVQANNCQATIYTFLNYPDSTTAGLHPFSLSPELGGCTLTNTYKITKDFNFVIPVSEIISTMTYEENEEKYYDSFAGWLSHNYVNMDDIHSKEEFDKYQEEFEEWRLQLEADKKAETEKALDNLYLSHSDTILNPTTDYNVRIVSVPMVKANIMKSTADYNTFLSNFRSMYSYLKSAMELLVNNFEVDLKFFNTYGPSRHFYYYDNYGASGLMDSVNIKLRFGVKFSITTGIENAVSSLIEYIIDYVESDKVSLINSPSLYISNLIQSIINDFESVAYITFKGLNNYNEGVQKFESEITDINVLEGSFATNDVVPEYLTVDQIIKKTIKTPQVIIDVL